MALLSKIRKVSFFETAQSWQNGRVIPLLENKHRLKAVFLIGILP